MSIKHNATILEDKQIGEQEIEAEFEDIIREKMTDEQFKDWFMNWIDVEEAIKMCLSWDTEDKANELPELRKIIKKNKK